MITKWKVFNFKSVRKETELVLSPLTIFAGANSSGKSTFLQSILLVAQTLSHKVGSRSVVLNGAFARLGQFDDLRSTDAEADQIVVGWTCIPMQEPQALRRRPFFYGRPGASLSSVACEIAFDTEESGTDKEVTQIQPRLFSSMLEVVARDREGSDRRSSLSVRRAGTSSIAEKTKWARNLGDDEAVARASFQRDVEIDHGSLAELREELVSAEPIGCLLRHFLPERLSLGVDLVAEDAKAICAVLAGDGRRGIPRRVQVERDIVVPSSVVEWVLAAIQRVDGDATKQFMERLERQPDLFGTKGASLERVEEALRRIPPRQRMEIRRELSETDELEELVTLALRDQRPEALSVVPARPPGAIAEGAWYLDQFFAGSVRYLGPLRDDPKSLYPLAPTADPSDVGIRGEHTAAVLELHKNRPIRYIPTSAFADPEIQAQPLTRSLETAVVDWLRYLGVAENVQGRDRGKFGHELKVNVAGTSRPHDLTHVGVGVSQVLPILVASLLADADTTLIFEQPELHLHPKVQTLLADFFLSMTVLGKQCLVETHSEYLINRIRFRAAAARAGNPWVAATKVYFVERPEGGSTFREVTINEYGAVVEWPDGFFDQSQVEAEAILRAAASKKKAQRGS